MLWCKGLSVSQCIKKRHHNINATIGLSSQTAAFVIYTSFDSACNFVLYDRCYPWTYTSIRFFADVSQRSLFFRSGLCYQIFLISSTQFTFILQSFLFFIFLISHFTHSQLIYLADTFYFNTSPPHLFHKIFTDCKSNSCSFFAVILPISPYKVFGRFSQMW